MSIAKIFFLQMRVVVCVREWLLKTHSACQLFFSSHCIGSIDWLDTGSHWNGCYKGKSLAEGSVSLYQLASLGRYNALYCFTLFCYIFFFYILEKKCQFNIKVPTLPVHSPGETEVLEPRW